MLGYVLGMAVTPVLAGWVRESGGQSLSEVLFMCSLLFEIAFLFWVIRLLLRGVRWSGRFFMNHWRTTTPQAPSGSPGH